MEKNNYLAGKRKNLSPRRSYCLKQELMNTWYYAFFIGLAGSWHCAIMCGPIMQQIEQRGAQTSRMWLYTFGRIFMYGILGFFVSKVGSIWLFPAWWHIYYLFAGLVLVLLLSQK